MEDKQVGDSLEGTEKIKGSAFKKSSGKKKRKVPGKSAKIPKKEREAPKDESTTDSKWPYLGVVLVLFFVGLVVFEDLQYHQERSEMLRMVEEWVLPGEEPRAGRASLNASRSMEYRQALMTGQGFLRASRIQPESARESLAMARYHFKLALKQLGKGEGERARLKLRSKIASIEKLLGSELEVSSAAPSDEEDPGIEEKEISVGEGGEASP